MLDEGEQSDSDKHVSLLQQVGTCYGSKKFCRASQGRAEIESKFLRWKKCLIIIRSRISWQKFSSCRFQQNIMNNIHKNIVFKL
jgi:hypothetical protein